MKWSQGFCAAILMDELYALSPAVRRKPRAHLAGIQVDPAPMPNILKADWGLSPEVQRTGIVNTARGGAPKNKPPTFRAESYLARSQ